MSAINSYNRFTQLLIKLSSNKGIMDYELRDHVGVNQKTWTKRKKEPCSLTLENFKSLSEILSYPVHELVKAALIECESNN